MVRRGTHLMKSHESQSKTNESKLKKIGVTVKKMSPKLKMLGLFCNQRVNLKTDRKTLYTVFSTV